MDYDWVMFTLINEKVTVAGVYTGGTFIPRWFIWKGKKTTTHKATYAGEYCEGQNVMRCYSFYCSGAIYRILFNKTRDEWILREVYCA